VVSDRAAWIVIHDDQNGKPGEPIGRARITEGVNQNVSVDLAVRSATLDLHAILHLDEGNEGLFEYPEFDVPLIIDGEMVSQAFQQRLE
jgi:hypothetical protein